MLRQPDDLYLSSRMRGPSATAWIYLLAEFLFGFFFSILLAMVGIVKRILPKPPRDLTGDIVLITGITSSLGKWLAEEFASAGCSIVCVDSDLESVRKTADELASRYTVIEAVGPPGHRKQDAGGVGKRVWSYQCDLKNRNAIREVAERVNNEIGRIDVLVTCTGFPGEDIFDTVSTTLMSHYWTVLSFLPTMMHQQSAHIVGITPTTSTDDAYMGTRAAIAGLMDSIGQEFSGPGGQVNFITVAPKADPHLLSQTDEKVAKEVVQAVRTDQNSLSGSWWSKSIYKASCAIHGGITRLTRWLYTQGCDDLR